MSNIFLKDLAVCQSFFNKMLLLWFLFLGPTFYNHPQLKLTVSGFDVGLLVPLPRRVDSFVSVFFGSGSGRLSVRRSHSGWHSSRPVAAGMRRRQLVHRCRMMRVELGVPVGTHHVVVVRVELLLDPFIGRLLVIRPIAAAVFVVVVGVHVIQMGRLERGEEWKE